MKRKVLLFFSLVVSAFLTTGCANTVRFSKNEDRSKETSVQVQKQEVKGGRYFTKQSDEEFQALAHLEDGKEIEEEEMPDEGSGLAIDLNSGTTSTYLSNDMVDKMKMSIIEWLNTPYVFGGMSKKGIDCSAFTLSVYQSALNKPLLRTAAMQFSQGMKIDREDLQFGDLVFFNTRRRVRVGHVGMYIGNGQFVHASSRNGVIISSMDQEYYAQRYLGARRYVNDLGNNQLLSAQ